MTDPLGADALADGLAATVAAGAVGVGGADASTGADACLAAGAGVGAGTGGPIDDKPDMPGGRL
jgi:hypothetical protein